jgi:hypothetical protein
MMDSVAFRIPPTVLFREVQGELVMLDVVGEQYYGLDEIGRHIVTAITEQPFDAALAHLESLFDVDLSGCARTLNI